MRDRPTFLDLPVRDGKPRLRGLTHVLDKGMTPPALDALLAQCGEWIDVVKVGWGIGYLDPALDRRVALCHSAGVSVTLGGTLLEIAVAQGKLAELRRWALAAGIDAIEVSNGLEALTSEEKVALVRGLARDFVVFAEAGAKDRHVPVLAAQWVQEMQDDLDAGARWVIAEGRESGTVGLYRDDGTVREDLVDALTTGVPVDRIIFEAPLKSQQSWFIHHLGPDVNLGNVPPDEVLPLETLRLGLRADTAKVPVSGGTRVLAS